MTIYDVVTALVAFLGGRSAEIPSSFRFMMDSGVALAPIASGDMMGYGGAVI